MQTESDPNLDISQEIPTDPPILDHPDIEPESIQIEKKKNICTHVKDAFYPFYKLLVINKKFRWVFLSAFVSTMGNYFSEVAMLSLVEANTGRNGGFGIAATYLCLCVPPILLMLVTGITADRCDKRKVMFISDLTRGACIFGLFLFSSFFDIKANIWVVFVTLFSMMSFGAFFDPAREGFIPFIVPKDELITGNTLDGITWMTCTVIGASLGGLVTWGLGVRWNFLMDSFSFMISAVFVWQLMQFDDLSPESLKDQEEKMRIEEEKEEVVSDVPKEDEMEEKETIEERLTVDVEPVLDGQVENVVEIEKSVWFSVIWTEVKGLFHGLKFLFTHPYSLSLVLIKASFTFFFVNVEFLILKFGDSQFRIGDSAAAMYGMAKALIGVSAAAGPVLLVTLFNMTGKRMRLFIFLNTLIQIVGFLILFWSPNVWVFLLGSTIVGGTCGIPWGFSTAMVQKTTPKHLIGRVMAVDFGLFQNLSNGMAVILCGVCLDVFNFTPNQLSLLGVGFGCILSVYYGLWLIITRNIE